MLTFAAPVMVKNLFNTEGNRMRGSAGGGKRPVFEICLHRALEQLGLSMAQFVDMCVLCGCDYAPHVKGLGAYVPAAHV